MSDKKTILIIEDEKDLSEILADAFKARGFDVQACTKYSEAVFRLKNQTYNCILLDLVIDQGNGTDLVRKLRDDDKDPNHKTPVLIVSGHVDNQARSELKGLVNGFVEKPIDTDKLGLEIDRVLGKTAD